MNIEFANRTEIGLCVWSCHDTYEHIPELFFDYEDVLATAALVLDGWSVVSAASVVHHSLVYAVPVVFGQDRGLPDFADPVGRLEMFQVRLPDGTIWAIMADNDMLRRPRGIPVDDKKYGACATRGLTRSDEDIFTRVANLLTRIELPRSQLWPTSEAA
ncbi:hypothetical protein EUV02_04070 [Polymorphobacter arshaanensis]|uniref:Uncharacterized protein n=1 Tax=Glacieibacterium arshaanense TaxID=2511025 RepID=A0A4Y9ERE5_9SPHN|nr:hypothetical protein [Polymorphobacter arshaanensis]TFU06195.1 hypothetical protein EUV02_04070 [Polymorphobacter arshaanensis]